ncbi:MAG: ABC transporter permease [Clostridiales bacterium]|nr:ABC transporter permease [Clostridiales bacterium]
MKFYARNLARSVFGHPKVNLIILFDLILTAAAVFVLIQNFYFLKEKHDEFFGEDRVAKTYELYVGESVFPLTESDAQSKSNMFYLGLELYKEINASPIKTFSYTHDRRGMRGGFYDKATDEKMIASGHRELIDWYYVSDYALEAFGLKMSEGRWFNNEELDYPYLQVRVPVIFGSNFASAFDVGDVIIFDDDNYYHDEAVVVGILESSPGIEYYGITQSGFDDAVIFPEIESFPRLHARKGKDFSGYADLPKSIRRRLDYVDRERFRTLTTGYLYCPDESVDVQKLINDYTSKYGFYQITATPIDGTSYSETKSISERNLLLIGVLAVSTTVICMISLGGVLYNRTLDDRRTYCIYMSAGIPLWKINLSLIMEMLIWMVISLMPVIALSLYEFETLLIPLWQIALFELIVMSVSIAPSLRVNSKCNLDLLIRNQMN